MSKLHTMEERMNALFGEPAVLPTADELVAAGDLVDATAVYAAGNGSDPDQQARLLFSSAAWDDLAAWSEHNTAYQDVSGRIHDVLMMSRSVELLTGRVRRDRLDGQPRTFYMVRIPNQRLAEIPRAVNVTVTGVLESGRPALTFSMPNEK